MSGDIVFDYGGFKSGAERLKNERAERQELGRRMFSYGIPFLDDCLRGVWPRDLIILGAYTGIGKTELAVAISLAAVDQGKRVDFLALEAEDLEIERRVKFKIIAELARRDMDPNIRALNYTDWLADRLPEFDDRYGVEAERRAADRLRRLFTYYKASDFGRDELRRHVLSVQDLTDFAVLDHLHYVDLDDDNENRALRRLVKTARDLALGIGKPMLVIAHLRKRDRMRHELVPTLDDFHGTSDTPKIATRAVMMARGPYSPETGKVPTYIHVPKDRVGGATGLIALLKFDLRSRTYDNEYVLGRAVSSKGREDFEPISADQIPQWAKRATIPAAAVPTYSGRGPM